MKNECLGSVDVTPVTMDVSKLGVYKTEDKGYEQSDYCHLPRACFLILAKVMTVASFKLYLAVFLIASICSSVLSNSRRSENGGKQRKEETPFWAARGKRAELAGGIIRCGIVRPSPVESDSEISWPEIEPTGEDDLTGRVKRSAGSSLKGEIEPVPLWLTRASMEMERPGYQQYFYPYSHNERLMNFLRQLQEKRADRGAEKNANSESAPFWAPRG